MTIDAQTKAREIADELCEWELLECSGDHFDTAGASEAKALEIIARHIEGMEVRKAGLEVAIQCGEAARKRELKALAERDASHARVEELNDFLEINKEQEEAIFKDHEAECDELKKKLKELENK